MLNIVFNGLPSLICIQYTKPPILLEMERQVLLMLKEVVTERDLDKDCDELMKKLMNAAEGVKDE